MDWIAATAFVLVVLAMIVAVGLMIQGVKNIPATKNDIKEVGDRIVESLGGGVSKSQNEELDNLNNTLDKVINLLEGKSKKDAKK